MNILLGCNNKMDMDQTKLLSLPLHYKSLQKKKVSWKCVNQNNVHQVQSPFIDTSTKGVMFLVQFVCSSSELWKNYQAHFLETGERMQHGPRKNPLNFGADPNYGTDTDIFHFHKMSRIHSQVSLASLARESSAGRVRQTVHEQRGHCWRQQSSESEK